MFSCIALFVRPDVAQQDGEVGYLAHGVLNACLPFAHMGLLHMQEDNKTINKQFFGLEKLTYTVHVAPLA